MLSSKTLKIVGLGLSGLGAVVGFAGNLISDKRQSLEMTEQINEAVKKELADVSIQETVEEL